MESNMNPNSATLRSTDLCALLGVSDQSVFRWLSGPYPSHIFTSRARHYALPEIVGRLRERRARGLTGADLAALVAYDTQTRAARDTDSLWLGDGAQDRAASFFAALIGEEVERARDCMKAVRHAATDTGLSGVNRLAQIALIQPGLVRFILTGEADERPVGDGGWQSFAKALWAVNPAENIEVAA